MKMWFNLSQSYLFGTCNCILHGLTLARLRFLSFVREAPRSLFDLFHGYIWTA